MAKRDRADAEALNVIAEHMGDVIIRVSGGVLTYVSPSVRRYGYEPADLVEKPLDNLVHPDDREALAANNAALLAGVADSTAKREHRFRAADGRWIWMEGNPRVVLGADGKVAELINIFRDITRRRELEEEARAQAEQFEAAFRSAAVGMALASLDGTILRVNAAFCRFIGYSEAELKTLGVVGVTHPEDVDADFRLLGQLAAGEIESYRLDKRYVRADGEQLWGNLSVSMVRDADGAPQHVVAQVQDLTDRRAAEAALMASEARYRLIAETTADVTVTFDLGGRLTYASPAARLYGYEPEAVVGMTIADLVHPDDLARTQATLAGVLAGRPPPQSMRQMRFRTASGGWVWLEGSSRPILDEQGRPTGFVDSLRDVTERREQEALFETAFEQATMSRSMVDLEGHILRANQATCEMLGYSQVELLALPLLDLIHPDERGRDSADAARLIAGEIESYESTRRVRHADGRYIWVRMTVALVRYADGRPKHLVTEAEDLTERRAAEAALKASEARYRLLAENSADVIVQTDLHGVMTYVSPAVRVLGHDADALIGTKALDLLHPDDRRAGRTNLTAAATGEAPPLPVRQARFRTADGRWIWVESSASVVRDDDGKPIGFVTSLRDVTDRREQEALFEAAFEQAGMGRVLIDLDGRYVRANKAACQMLGYTEAELQALPPRGLSHPDDRDLTAADAARLVVGEIDHYESVRQVRRKDGSYVPTRLKVALVRYADGRPKYFVIESEDLTERRAAEAALKASEERYRLIAENTSDLIVMTDLNGVPTYVSPTIAMGGGGADDLVGENPTKDIHPDDHAAVFNAFGRLLRGEQGEPVRWRAQNRATGDWSWLESNPSLLRDPETGKPTGFLDVVRNVQAQVEHEAALAAARAEAEAAAAALKASEERYRLIAENSSDMIFMGDLDSKLRYVSPSIASLGYAPEALVGRSLVRHMHPDDVARAERIFAALPSGDSVERVRWRLRHQETAEWVWMESRPTLLRDPVTGEANGFLDVVRNVTAQVAQEDALATARAEAESAAATKGQFLANMSHEIRTPLTAVLGFASLLSEMPDLPPTAADYVSRIAGAGKGLLAIINDILDFSKLEAGKFEIRPRPTDLRAVCEETLLLFSTQADAKGLALAFEAAPGLPDAAMMDADRLRQMLINLIGNAIKFTEAGGVTLAIRPAADGAVEIAVTDTGPGLDAEAQAILFQRFTQVDGSKTRRHGGTGLGLAICKGVAEAMGGSIGVSSTPGEGATFRLLLPAPAADEAPAVIDEPAPRSIAGVRVFVVDDNPVNRELARRVLEIAGADAHEAANGAEAVARLAELPMDVVLMDLRMPGLDGRGALVRLRGRKGPNQHTPVLAFTADADVQAEGDLSGFDGLVRKPIQPMELFEAIAAAVEWRDAPEASGAA